MEELLRRNGKKLVSLREQLHALDNKVDELMEEVK
jgi:hypothetical protein